MVEWEVDKLDPFGEENWDEEMDLDEKNYISYDNIKFGHSNYPVGSPVFHYKSISTPTHNKNGMLGYVTNIISYEPTYTVLWSNNNSTNEYSYNLLFNKNHIPSDWTPGKNKEFTLGDNIIYELIMSFENDKMIFKINKLNIHYIRGRHIEINNSIEVRNISNVWIGEFLNKKYGYLQDSYNGNRRYNKNIIHFTNKFDIDTDSKGFMLLIKRRFSAYQTKLTRIIKKDIDILGKFKNDIESIKSIDDKEKINNLDFFNISTNLTDYNQQDWIGIFYSPIPGLNNANDIKKITLEARYGTPVAKYNWNYRARLIDFNENNNFYIITEYNRVFIMVRVDSFDELNSFIKNKFIKECILLKNKVIKDNEIKYNRLKEKTDILTTKKTEIMKQKKSFKIDNIIKDYLV